VVVEEVLVQIKVLEVEELVELKFFNLLMLQELLLLQLVQEEQVLQFADQKVILEIIQH
jgi:hypothetical protein